MQFLQLSAKMEKIYGESPQNVWHLSERPLFTAPGLFTSDAQPLLRL